jgi:hypothetical protein
VAFFCLVRACNKTMAENISKAKGFLDTVTDRVTDWIPKNLNAWLVALTCLIVIVALSRLMSLQKSVSELQSRPSVDEHLVRQVVRQHLEETVRAMDQQNRVQLQMRQQQMLEQARKAQQAMLEKQKEASATKIEILDSSEPPAASKPEPVDAPAAPAPSSADTAVSLEETSPPPPVAPSVPDLPPTTDSVVKQEENAHAAAPVHRKRVKGKPLAV